MEPSCNTSEGDLPFIDLPIIDIVKLKGQSGDVEKTKETQKLIDAFTEVRNSRCVQPNSINEIIMLFKFNCFNLQGWILPPEKHGASWVPKRGHQKVDGLVLP